MFCGKCGNQVDEKDQFCSKCGTKAKENTQSNKKSRKVIMFSAIGGLLLMAIVITFMVSLGNKSEGDTKEKGNISTDLNKDELSQTSSGNTEPTQDTNALEDNTQISYVGNSQVTLSQKEGRTYFTSSDGNWTVEQNNVRYTTGNGFVDQRSVLENVEFASTPAWQAQIPYTSNLTIYFNTTSELAQGATYTLRDAGGIRNGYIMHTYLEDKAYADPDAYLETFYIAATTTLESDEEPYNQSFDSFEFKVDCYDKAQGILCGYLSFVAPLADGTSLNFQGYCAFTLPGFSPSSGGSINTVQVPQLEYVEIPSESTTVQSPKTCVVCYGSGICNICNGSGIYRNYGQSTVCSACNGSGRCDSCDGTGVY